MNLPEAFVGETERIVDHFNTNAATCLKHNKKPTLIWDGCWMIDCPVGGKDGCRMSDGDNHNPTKIILRWSATRGLRIKGAPR